MDTILICNNRRIFNVVGIAINFLVIGLIVLMPVSPIFAKDLIAKVPNPTFDSAQLSVKIMSTISEEDKIKKFDENIYKKYPNAAILNVDDGIKHIKLTKYYDGKPVRINVVEIDKNIAKDYELTPVLASDKLNSRSKISNIARKKNSMIALNGTFFKPQTGVPLGTLMIDGNLYTGPIYDRVAFGIFDDGYDIARVKLNASIVANNKNIKIDNINQPRMLSTYVLVYTPAWGNSAPLSPKYGLQVTVKNDRIVGISECAQQIPNDGYVIVGPASSFNGLQVGDKLKLNIATNPEWKNVKHIISGGPYLVKDNEVFVDVTEQKLKSITGKNPRSAIGYTKDGNLILVVVDGREGRSVGMTLTQLANFMHSIGCTNAINLDGGGSSVMYINGKIVNNPQQNGGVPISNALVLSPKI